MLTLNEIKKALETATWIPFPLDLAFDTLEKQYDSYPTFDSGEEFAWYVAWCILREYNPTIFDPPSSQDIAVTSKTIRLSLHIPPEYTAVYTSLCAWIKAEMNTRTSPDKVVH